jgi:hypothetical protein
MPPHQSSRGNNPSVLEFNLQSCSEAPAYPGIYAFYANLRLGDSDIIDSEGPPGLSGQTKLLTTLTEHTLRIATQSLNLTGRSAFNAQWKGEISDMSCRGIQDFLAVAASGVASTPKRLERLTQATASEPDRRLMVDLLRTLQPHFSMPLYIGTTKNLRTRLRKHTRRFYRLYHDVTVDPQKRNAILRPRHFAERAIKQGFRPEGLLVYCWDLRHFWKTSPEKKQLARVVLGLESLLNTWSRPPLGRL